MEQNEFIERMRAVPETFADRVAEPNLEVLRGQAWAGEWQLTLQHLVGYLAVTDQAMTPDEHDELWALFDHLSIPPDSYLANLRVT
jgi:hypothetical protein